MIAKYKHRKMFVNRSKIYLQKLENKIMFAKYKKRRQF